jgi:hypothetical protein
MSTKEYPREKTYIEQACECDETPDGILCYACQKFYFGYTARWDLPKDGWED